MYTITIVNFWGAFMERKEVGRRIRELREQRGWHKGTLATRAGIAPSYIPVLENGEKSPTIETLDAICFAFGITLSDFFAEKLESDLVDKVSSLTDKQKRLLNEFLNSL